MDYIRNNKWAWEEAFENRRPGWGEENHKILMTEELPFLNCDTVEELKKINLQEKVIAQFCCNNGRELLSAMQLNPTHAVGFDIAVNIIGQAKETARKMGVDNCEFIACDILEINDSYHNSFDFIFFTIGAITWFENLSALFKKAANCLKQDGILLINDFHPFINMLPIPGEEVFDSEKLNQVAYSYFRKEPWIENNGMSYITPEYESKTFTSFTHTLSDIINSAINSGMSILKLNEYNYDVGITDVYDDKGYPLSYIMLAQKK